MKIKKRWVFFVFAMLMSAICYQTVIKSTAMANDFNYQQPIYGQYPQQRNIAPVNQQRQESLNDFVKNTKTINASYKYPSMPAQQKKVTSVVLPAHTPVLLRNMNTISTNNIISGSNVNFLVMSDVKDRLGNILIKAGTPATAQITFARQTGDNLGMEGKVEINDFHTTAIDGTFVPLSGSLSAKGENRMALSIVLSVLICPLFLLMDGNEATIPAGATKTVFTVSEVYINP